MAQSNDILEQVERLENDQIDLKLAVSSLLAIVEQHQTYHETSQRNVETSLTEIHSIRADMREMQMEVRGLQTENRRVLDILQNWNGEQQ